jgi:predicted nuclease of restriction endonuclease-like (RecB) superfamily
MPTDNDQKRIAMSGDEELSVNFTQDYRVFLAELKDKIRSARLKAALAINKEVIELYWHMGKQIIEKKNWGSKLVETLSLDLQNAFPETRGFSVRNLRRMRQFAAHFPDITIMPQAVAQLPWGHISLLIHKINDKNEFAWYAEQTIEQGWPRLILERHLKDNLFQRQAIDSVKASNFLTRLPSPQSKLAHELLKQPYNLDFLGLHDDALEREIEHASIEHITKFLLELGKGFAFVGRQIPIGLEESGYFMDMLFYHLKLHAYVVVEFKTTKFKPEHAGQLNFYLNLVDDFYKMPEDNPTIGLLLCKSRNKFEAEYALKGIEKPIGISEYQLTRAIPESLKLNLPTIAEIEAELNELDSNQK